MCRVLAADIGAGSYRVMEGTYTDRGLDMKELARFRHAPVQRGGHYYWDIEEMRDNLIQVVRAAAKQGERIRSIGFDTFGSDFGLLDRDGVLLDRPLAYRDKVSDGIYEAYFKEDRAIYARTGVTYAATGTAHILKGMAEQKFPALKHAARLLFLPDLLAYLFTGAMVNEYTIATTSLLLDVERREWDMGLIERLGLPAQIFHPLSASGTSVGPLRKEISEGIPNLQGTVVTASACHDTASAACVVPYVRGRSFISSGSWSVKGIVCGSPYTSEAACACKMSNEGQPGGKYRLIRNITGLWILEECARAWRAEGMEVHIPELAKRAEEGEDFPSMISTDATDFKKPGNMPEKIRTYCARTRQKVPGTPEEVMRTVINGLALEYRRHNEQLEGVTGCPVTGLYIVGGGRHNRLLNQCAADATQCPVVCGHPEAAAAGNILIQLHALGAVPSMDEFPRIAAKDVPEVTYIPCQKEIWEERYGRYLDLIR
ncbi:rhamnulokinase [Clostridium sp. AF15-17LB]|nr:rhamnulokinase [Clostridium sp. AF15-17LB]